MGIRLSKRLVDCRRKSGHKPAPRRPVALNYSRSTNGFQITAEHLKEIVNFGKWISVSSFATFISSYSDIIILGLLLPSPLLGIYYIAKTLRDAIEFSSNA